MFNAVDIDEQSELRSRPGRAGLYSDHLWKKPGTSNAENLKAARAELESGKAIGKIFLEGFD